MQNIDDLVELHECPLCEGGSILEEEGNGFYAQFFSTQLNFGLTTYLEPYE